MKAPRAEEPATPSARTRKRETPRSKPISLRAKTSTHSRRPPPQSGPTLSLPRITGVGAWLLLAMAAYFVARAQPPSQFGFFSRVSYSASRVLWDRSALGWALGALVSASLVAIYGATFYASNPRRKGGDRLHIPLLATASIAAILSFFCAAFIAH